MGVRIIYDGTDSVIYDSVTGTAFGPVLNGADPDEVEGWLASLPDDARVISVEDLHRSWAAWCAVFEESDD